MARFAARTLALLSVVPLALTGCHGVPSSGVPWYRGIPANFLSRNSLEAEIWRQQRTGVVEGWPTPPQPAVREPIPSAGETTSPNVEGAATESGAGSANGSAPGSADPPRTPTEATRPPTVE